MFLHVSVILSTDPSPQEGRTPWKADPSPWKADPLPPKKAGPPREGRPPPPHGHQAAGTHPTGMLIKILPLVT